MKRLIAILLVISLALSISGCVIAVNEEAIEDHIKGKSKELLNKPIEFVNKVIDDIIPDTYIISYFADGAINVPKEQTIGFWSGKLSKNVPERVGYIFLGWATTADATTASYQPGQEWDKKESAELYAVWTACENHSYTIVETISDKLLTKDKEDTYAIKCEKCSSPYPVNELNFSTFMKYFSPKQDINELKEKKKTEEIDAYIRTKVSMAVEQRQNYENYSPLVNEKGEANYFEIAATVAGQISEGLETVTLQNLDSFFMLSTAITVAAEDCGFDNVSVVEIINGMNTLENISSFAELVATAGNARNIAQEYRKIKEIEGKEYIYYQNKKYVDLVIANADTATKLVIFLGDVCNFDTVVPTPAAEDILAEVKKQAEIDQMKYVYQILVYPINGYLSINDFLGALGCKEKFKEINYYDSVTITDAMKAGPWAKDIFTLITDPEINILSKVENIHGAAEQDIWNNAPGVNVNTRSSKEMVETALWYYYGWRMEYEYNTFLEWIYDNEVGSFESYLQSKIAN